MTAVEWLIDKLWDMPKDKFIWDSLLVKAKQMEKEQMATKCNQLGISDEDIRNAAIDTWQAEYQSGLYVSAFELGAKWYREQLKQKQ